MVAKSAAIELEEALPYQLVAPPPPIVAPTTPVATVFAGEPPMKFGAPAGCYLCHCRRRCLQSVARAGR